MGRLRRRWVRWLVAWTLVSLLVAAVVAFEAMASLYDAQQACFFQFPAVPCPGGDDPAIARLTFAFFGVPLVWLAGLGLIAGAKAWERHNDERPR